jgi:hypothetical protein
MAESSGIDWMSKALAYNSERRKVRFMEAQQTGAAWLVECRDLYDSSDADAGVYFEACYTESDVDKMVARMDGMTPERILGIYSLARAVELLGPGLRVCPISQFKRLSDNENRRRLVWVASD